MASLAGGYTAIVDATFLRPDDRQQITAYAKLARVPFIGIWLEAPSDVLMARLRDRGKDASDADILVLQQQFKMGIGVIEWHRMDVETGERQWHAAPLNGPICEGATGMNLKVR
jgi:predicted kinase